MDARTLTLIDDGRVVETTANFDDAGIQLAPAELTAALGWTLKEEGLCKDDVCVPVRDRGDRVNAAGVDLQAFADLLGRPLAIEAEAGLAVLGASADARGAQLASQVAPDFALPDLEGKMHTLWEHRGKKVLLVAYASW